MKLHIASVLPKRLLEARKAVMSSASSRHTGQVMAGPASVDLSAHRF